LSAPLDVEPRDGEPDGPPGGATLGGAGPQRDDGSDHAHEADVSRTDTSRTDTSRKDQRSDLRRLVEAARGGDQAAWEALYRSIYPRLRAFFVRRVGSGHADDAVSETMTRAVSSIERFAWTDAGFDGWVFGIARHISVDHHRRQDRARRYHHIGRMFSPNKSDGAAPVEQELVINDDQALVRDLFTRLNPAEQEILELRVIAGLSALQVGEVLGQSAGAVRTAQSRALAHLRELMEHHGG
jgi:RNA polymerase sigma-70 factor (ECF subfamily)